MAGQQLGRRLGGIVLIAVATACLLAGVMMLSSGGRATELVSKEGELRRELRQNVKRQRVLGSEVKALIAASQMEAARTQSLVKVPAEDGKIDALEVWVLAASPELPP